VTPSPGPSGRLSAEAPAYVLDAVTSWIGSLAADPARPGRAPRGPETPGERGTEVAGGMISGIISVAMRHVDPNVLLDRVDVEAILARVDLDALLARVDMDRLLDRVDPNPVLARVDVETVVERIDMGPLAAEAIEGIDMGAVIRQSTATLGADALDDLRAQSMRADDLLARIVDRLLRRDRPRRTEMPGRPPG
jgi:hypothetical protein